MNKSLDPLVPASELIRIRTSVRTYLKEAIPEDVLKNVDQKIKDCSTGPMGTKIRFNLISLNDHTTKKMKLGTYGFIQGASCFIAGQIKPSKDAFLDYGFCLEKIILELTRMGLGTCWLGGTFDRGEFSKAIHLDRDHVIPAITPTGYSASARRLGERLIRMGAGAGKRLPHDRLFFDKASGNPLSSSGNQVLAGILDSVRMAPSASNIQPWRIAAEDNKFMFHLSRKPGYRSAFNGVDMQMIDMGIALSHFDLVSRETGKIPIWENSSSVSPFRGWEYVISLILPQ